MKGICYNSWWGRSHGGIHGGMTGLDVNWGYQGRLPGGDTSLEPGWWKQAKVQWGWHSTTGQLKGGGLSG